MSSKRALVHVPAVTKPTFPETAAAPRSGDVVGAELVIEVIVSPPTGHDEPTPRRCVNSAQGKVESLLRELVQALDPAREARIRPRGLAARTQRKLASVRVCAKLCLVGDASACRFAAVVVRRSWRQFCFAHGMVKTRFVVLGLALAIGCSSTDEGENSQQRLNDDCYSPTQNVDRAYHQGAVGCACAPGTAGACVPDSSGRLVALICEAGRWQAVEDGPCGV